MYSTYLCKAYQSFFIVCAISTFCFFVFITFTDLSQHRRLIYVLLLIFNVFILFDWQYIPPIPFKPVMLIFVSLLLLHTSHHSSEQLLRSSSVSLLYEQESRMILGFFVTSICVSLLPEQEIFYYSLHQYLTVCCYHIQDISALYSYLHPVC